jgi:hypothetical protein
MDCGETSKSLIHAKVFNVFQEEVNAARDHCSIVQTTQDDSVKYVIVGGESMRDIVVK